MTLRTTVLRGTAKDDQTRAAILETLKEEIRRHGLASVCAKLYQAQTLAAALTDTQALGLMAVLSRLGQTYVREAIREWIESGEIEKPEGW